MKIVVYLKFAGDYRAYAVVDRSACKGCGVCLKICPFGIPVLRSEDKAEISPEHCKGCGACVSYCTAGSISMAFTLATAPYTSPDSKPQNGQYPLDRGAIEAGLALKDRFGGEVWVLGMGPSQCLGSMREALAMGADEAVLLCDGGMLGSSYVPSARILAMAIQKIGSCDLLIAPENEKSQEASLALAWVAENLGMAYLPRVRDMGIDGDRLLARREGDEELLEYSLCLPAAITATARYNDNPRSLSLLAAAQAMQKTVPMYSLDDLGLSQDQAGEVGSAVHLERVETPPRKKAKKRKVQFLEGSCEGIADDFVKLLETWGLP